MNQASNFNYHSLRARKARFAARISKFTTDSVLLAIVGVLVVSGLALLFLHYSFGLIIVSLAILPYCLHEWVIGELKSLTPNLDVKTLDQTLETELLGKLPEELTPKILLEEASKTVSGKFLMSRMGLSWQFIDYLASSNPDDLKKILDKSLEINLKNNKDAVNGASILFAIISISPDAPALLAHLQLDPDDLYRGVEWFSRLNQLIRWQNSPRKNGGIGRDWSFGFTRALNHYGQNISEQIVRSNVNHVKLESHQAALNYLTEIFGSHGRQNAAIIGPLGSGKTTLLYAFADLLMNGDSKIPDQLKFRQIINLNASSLISSSQRRGDLEELVNHLLIEAYDAKNIILCLDDAELFFEDGVGSVDLSSLLLPVLESGALKIILTMDEQSWLRISVRNPALAANINKYVLQPASEEETMRVMWDQLIILEYSRKVFFMYQALKEAQRLSMRYLYDQAMPGKAVRLLESSSNYADENKVVSSGSVHKAIEATMGVKVSSAANDSDERQKLLQLEDLIHERMINQTRAVKVVSDAIRRARTGVKNEKRPIGTFLFLGPTGVGKTELARSLAAVYFGGEDRMIQIDLNEFSRPDDSYRLIASGVDAPNGLISSVMRQPFSVILLDEIEKAHPQVLATLLQVLDEGVLRDSTNREISFRDTIIVATSNAGSEDIRSRVEAGQQIEQFEQEIQDELIKSNQFRPEFLNRFDEIVVFRPLTQDELMQVIDLLLINLNKTLEYQKIKVLIDDEAKRTLVQRGYDPRLGARPMRRVVQRTVESLIARKLLDGSLAAGQTLVITGQDLDSTT
jgi:ATP-dependent Clp protease ATP-binding subunit ClpC